MTAWRDLKPNERDRILLAAAWLIAPDPIHVNPRSKNDREWAAPMVKRGLLSKQHTITPKGKRALKALGEPKP